MAVTKQTHYTFLLKELMNEQRIISAADDGLCSSQVRLPGLRAQFSAVRAVSGLQNSTPSPMDILNHLLHLAS